MQAEYDGLLVCGLGIVDANKASVGLRSITGFCTILDADFCSIKAFSMGNNTKPAQGREWNGRVNLVPQEAAMAGAATWVGKGAHAGSELLST